MDMRLFRPYVYRPEQVDAWFDAHQRPDRIEFVVLHGEQPIGGLSLKHIDRKAGSRELGIHLQNDAVKGRGYGTQAERLALAYAFETLGLQAVHADAVLKNARSQHVLEKVGFRFVREEGIFRYYVCKRADWEQRRRRAEG